MTDSKGRMRWLILTPFLYVSLAVLLPCIFIYLIVEFQVIGFLTICTLIVALMLAVERYQARRGVKY